ncbi:uncharacterized protein Gasu_33400 [Galdieria sulphuraria]|uniref:Uncharacterized protein n=1 Tax=Galdieria sulphuraria TaxID=130081 RepID=M2WZ41_GALSU|nr:uncharacterized protein Gasu_33400 [Galdieria sulphuraria]EME29335.1 hypothetical protein Gasu_33400 [Galdieria sulphuraria]|eukprot:XP_005705855.1 hypothetical protein Gasu_33400 [Galdieria sulphuraria]
MFDLSLLEMNVFFCFLIYVDNLWFLQSSKLMVQEKAVKTFKPKQSGLPSKAPQLYSRLLGRDNSTMI